MVRSLGILSQKQVDDIYADLTAVRLINRSEDEPTFLIQKVSN